MNHSNLPILSLNQVSIQRGSLHVAQQIDLDLHAGKIYTVLGPNGTGKSSLIKAIFGELAHTGTISWQGQAQTQTARSDWVKPIGYMPQDSHVDAALSTLEVVLLGRMDALHMHVGDDVLNQAASLLDELGIAHLAHRPITALSGGQRQLAMFAQVLLRQPKILLLDEPVSALDMYHQLNLLEQVSRYTREHQIITLMVLHDLNLAAQFSDELILLANGKIQAQGQPAQVLQPDVLRDLYRVSVEVLTCSQGLPVIRPQRHFLTI
nr:ABC transporter ATP-binding protein [Kingella kingae]